MNNPMAKKEDDFDIYGQQKHFARYLERIRDSPLIRPVNKAALARFFSDHAKEAAGGLSIHRRTLYASRLLPLAEQVGDKDFMTLGKPDYERLASWVREKRIEYPATTGNRTRPREGQLLSFGTQKIFEVSIKKLLKYLHDWEKSPKELTRAFRFTGKTAAVKPEDLLTDKELQSIIDSADNPRDKAIIAVLAESGFRVSELGTMKVKSVMADPIGFKLSLQHSKTFTRVVRMVFHAVYLKRWLQLHPQRDNPEAPLWVCDTGARKGERMKYPHLRMAVLRAAQKAGVDKGVNPHSFRHLKTSKLAAMGMSDSQICILMGWEPGSRQLRCYSQLTDVQANDSYLEILGLKKSANRMITSVDNNCQNCGAVNKSMDETCTSCHLPLQLQAAVTFDTRLETICKRLEGLEPRIALLEKNKS